MEFGLSEDQQLLCDALGKFLREQVTLDHIRAHCDPKKTDGSRVLWPDLVNLGVPGLLIPEEFGGSGLRLFEAALVSEALGSVAAPAPFLGTAVLAPLALTQSPGNWGDFLTRIAAGELLVGVGLSDSVALREDAGVRLDGDRASGKALFVTDAQDADYLLIATVDGHLIWTEADPASIKPLTTIDQTRKHGLVNFKDQEVTALSRASQEGNPLTQDLLYAARVILAADILGSAQTMLDRAVAYSLEREQFGQMIGSFQAVKHMCAEMAAALEPCRSLVWYAAYSRQAEPDRFALMSCHAKAHLSDVGRFVAKTATEVHGGVGFTDLFGLHYWFKRIGMSSQSLGGPELVREEAAALQGFGTA